MLFLLNSCFWMGIGFVMARFFSDFLPRLLATIVVGFATIVILLPLLSLASAVKPAAATCCCVLALTVGLGAYRWRRTAGVGETGPSVAIPVTGIVRTYELRVAAILAVGFAIWTAVDCLIYGLFTPVLVDSDAPIYHLPFAIHWAKVGRLDFVATPFGEDGAPYFPANGDLWLVWLALTGQDMALLKVGQWPFLVIGGLAIFATGQQSGGSRESAAITSAVWCCLPLTLRQSSIANVDLIWTTFYLIALYFVMRFYSASRRRIPARRDLWTAALSLGIVIGTKSVGLAFAWLLILPLGWLVWSQGSSATIRSAAVSTAEPLGSQLMRLGWRRSLPVRMFGFCLLMVGLLLPSIFWFVRNLGMTGNPLYPLDVSSFNRRILVGLYDVSAMQATAYHIPVENWHVLATRLGYCLGPCLATLWFLCVLSGVLGSIWSMGKQAPVGGRLLSLLALLHVGTYWFLIPYNTQERFLLPALGIGVVPLSRAVSLWPRLVWPLGLIFLGHASMALLGDATVMDDVSFRTLRTLQQSGAAWRGLAFVGALVVSGMLARQGRRWDWITVSLAIVTGSSLYGAPLSNFARRHPQSSFYPGSGFGARMLPAWQIAANTSGPDGARIAYAGGNLPYYLLGSEFRNDAFYVNVNRHRDWLPHDYHRARRLSGLTDKAAIPWPQWYREEANYESWLENLRWSRTDLLFVTRTNLHGRRLDLSGELPAFPIERAWADAHPEDFEFLGPPRAPEGNIPWACVYRLRKSPRDVGATLE